MVLTPSAMIPLGTQAPDFTLPDAVSSKQMSLKELKSPIATVIMFICNHCPYVKHIQTELVSLTNEYSQKGISFIAINSNDTENYPDDSPEKMKETALEWNYCFPYLFDETQQVAKSFNATCTPDFYIFDANLKCVYRGQLDDSRPGNNIPLSGKDLRDALNALLKGQAISQNQKASVGCNIKWKK